MSAPTRLERANSSPRSNSDAVDEVYERRHCRQASHGDLEFFRLSGRRAIDDMGMRFRAFRKATELDNLGVLFVAEARLAGAKTRELARHVGERVWQVVSHNALPQWMKDNEFIQGGYRPELKSASDCFRSIFRLHTETGNIWTHLVGCVAFLVIALYYLSQESLNLARQGLGWQDRLVFGTFFACAIACLLFSALFHTMSCHSESVSYIFSKLDYCGIALMITGSGVPWLYYAFYCDLVSRLKYVVAWLVLGTICSFVTLSERFGESNYRLLRASVFSVFGFCGLIPAGHVLLTYGPETAFAHHAGDKLILMGALYTIGVLFYATRVPERFLPGRFDFFFHSHQIFHVCVVAAAFVTLNGLHEIASNALGLDTCSNLPYSATPFDD